MSYNGSSFRSKTEAAWASFFDAHNLLWSYDTDSFGLSDVPPVTGFWLPEIRTIVVVKGMWGTVDQTALHVLSAKAWEHRIMVILAEVPVGTFYRLVASDGLTNQVTFECCSECGRWRFLRKSRDAACPSCGREMSVSHKYQMGNGTRTPASFHDWACRLDVAQAFLAVGGVHNAVLGQPFLCPLPGHQEHRPSAAIWRMPDGAIRFRDFHGRSERQWFMLSEIYAAFKTGKVRTLTKGERAAWFLRGLVETGFLELPTLDFPSLPNGAKAIVQDVYEGFKLLQRLRRLYDDNQDFAAPYSWRFASRWCGRSERWVGKAIAWLSERGYLEMVKESNKMRHKARYYNLSPVNFAERRQVQ